jgi:hypothetical protein
MMTTGSAKQMLGIAMALGFCISNGESKPLSRPSDSRFASVKIENHTQKEIEKATIAIFKQAGYPLVGVKNELVFECAGKEWMQRAYGSNLSTVDPVQERVRAQVVIQDSGVFRLQCNAYIVQTSGGAEKEIAVRVRRSGPYRELLKEVTRKLSQTPLGTNILRE